MIRSGLTVEITDHFPVLGSFELVEELDIRLQRRRIFNNGGNAIFSEALPRVHPVINGDVNLTFGAYYMDVFGLYDEAFPIIEIIIKADVNCPWITPSIRACIKKNQNFTEWLHVVLLIGQIILTLVITLQHYQDGLGGYIIINYF